MAHDVIFLFAQAATETAEKSAGFFDALKAAFPRWSDALIFFAALVVAVAAGKLVRRGTLALSGRTHRALGGRGSAAFIVVNSLFRALPVAACAAAAAGYEFFRFPQGASGEAERAAMLLLDRAFWLLVVVGQMQVLWNLVRLPVYCIRVYAERRGRPLAFATLIPLAGAALQTLVLVWGVLLAARVLTDTPPAEILAMIGIGGLAVSLASQDTVKNFFGTAMLVVDRPFRVGDVIDFGAGTPGTVVRIGLRSTRLRTPDDHEISVPNADLANRVVTTISAREKIRRVMTLGLTYDTSPEKIEEAVRIVEDILKTSGKLAPDKPPTVFFSDFADSSLDLRVIYHFGSSSVAEANAFAQEVNLEILRRFAAAGIEFAFPTRTIVMSAPRA
ncbi:MAG: mechanosensitive ion channel family protein [Candidatus Spyradosoma sp.]